MKKKFSAVTALTLTLAMVLTACSGGGGGETTAAAGGDTKAAGETWEPEELPVRITPSAESSPMF